MTQKKRERKSFPRWNGGGAWELKKCVLQVLKYIVYHQLHWFMYICWMVNGWCYTTQYNVLLFCFSFFFGSDKEQPCRININWPSDDVRVHVRMQIAHQRKTHVNFDSFLRETGAHHINLFFLLLLLFYILFFSFRHTCGICRVCWFAYFSAHATLCEID